MQIHIKREDMIEIIEKKSREKKQRKENQHFFLDNR
jgi:hypothetical protein